MMKLKQASDKVVKGKKVLVDLNPTYSTMTWEILGQEPLPPNFAKLNIKIERSPGAMSDSFVQGIYVEPEGDPIKILFDPEPPKLEMATVANATSTYVDPDIESFDTPIMSDEELQAIIAAAEKAAYDRGLAEGKIQYESNINDLSTRWGAIISDMNEQAIQSRKQLEHDMIVFASDVVRYFLRGSVPGDEEVLTRIILEALDQVDRNTACEVLVNEVDFAIVEESPAILGILGKYGVQVVMENNIRSGCILQTENETFNFDILDAYERAVRELRGEKK
jgi:flagellar biosynthesis/type III secretory pathway protein FliH